MNKYTSIIIQTVPIMMGYIPLGMAFGFLITKSGIDWFIAPIFSLVAFAGAIQFLAIPMLLSGESYLNIAMMTLLVNFRHIFYGVSLFKFVPEGILKRVYFIFCITDENYSLLTSAKNIKTKDALILVFINHLYWVFGALIGALLAGQVEAINGLSFALTALFCVLFLEQYKSNPSIKLFGIAIFSTALASLISPQNFIVVASFLAMLMLFLDFTYSEGKILKNE